MTKLVNCTPHPLTIQKGSETTTLKPSGILPRVKTETTPSENIDGFELKETKTLGVEGLPPSEVDTLFIVSAMVAQASKRTDLICPNTGEAIRNEKGHIIAVPGFVRYK